MHAPPQKIYCVDDPRFDAHVSPPSHPERPARLAAVRKGLIHTLLEGGAETISARLATREELERVHSAAYLDELERALEQEHGYLDADTYFSHGTRTASWLAAGAAAQLGALLAQSEQSTSCVLAARPPGHHATRDRAMGFCLLNNVAVAAASALTCCARVAILDWDVHHGNGTQAIFEHDPRVMFISLHQWPQYPGTGRSEEVGLGDARGHTINLPLPTGSGSAEYGAAFRDVVLPRLTQFQPEVLLVSCGFDAHADDPLGGMELADQDYGAMTQAVWEALSQVDAKRLGIVLEGGYDLGALERASRSVGHALLGAAGSLSEERPRADAQRAIDDTKRAHDRLRTL